MRSLAILIDNVIWVYIWILILQVVLSWLVSFRVVNVTHPLVRGLYDITYRLTEPLLRPIRRLLPAMGGLDISPVILILLIQLLRNLLFEYVF